MSISARLAALNPAIIGQAEKAHGAILKRLLADTTLDEQQWITLQFAVGAGDAIGRGDLVTHVSARPSTITLRWKRRSLR